MHEVFGAAVHRLRVAVAQVVRRTVVVVLPLRMLLLQRKCLIISVDRVLVVADLVFAHGLRKSRIHQRLVEGECRLVVVDGRMVLGFAFVDLPPQVVGLRCLGVFTVLRTGHCAAASLGVGVEHGVDLLERFLQLALPDQLRTLHPLRLLAALPARRLHPRIALVTVRRLRTVLGHHFRIAFQSLLVRFEQVLQDLPRFEQVGGAVEVEQFDR